MSRALICLRYVKSSLATIDCETVSFNLPLSKDVLRSIQLTMNFKFVTLVICVIFAFSMTKAQIPVVIPDECAQSCPPGGKKLCAKNSVTKKMGTFESDCIFGRYNSCFKIDQQYEFVKYGEC